ncbi:MAG: hypothetical protein DLM65_07165 [Candidatus Aeolococcus gillhamiae]|uniref:Uncharacterized protein n=1 Tax=Candidatus Aeolococcus gillhamiae TaxID=3127015 RepID=A0A2W5ZAA4_9BACT|nr:MAG: hypothetical protein DLM65_07165 [Candidatus Dormibacter sp. RRmetagenome_bin12]
MTRCWVSVLSCAACAGVICPLAARWSISAFSDATSALMTSAAVLLCAVAIAAIVLPAVSSVCSWLVLMPMAVAITCWSSACAPGPP